MTMMTMWLLRVMFLIAATVVSATLFWLAWWLPMHPRWGPTVGIVLAAIVGVALNWGAPGR